MTNIVPLEMNMTFFPGPEEIACIAWNDGMFMEEVLQLASKMMILRMLPTLLYVFYFVGMFLTYLEITLYMCTCQFLGNRGLFCTRCKQDSRQLTRTGELT